MKKILVLILSFFLIFIAVIGCKKELQKQCADYATSIGFKGKPNAIDYNTIGLRYYEKKEYAKAADLFRCSIKKNNSYQVTHYNLACMLSLLFGEGKTEYKNELFQHLRIAIKLDPGYLDKITTDKDFDPVRNLPEFIAITKDSNKDALSKDKKNNQDNN